MIDYLMWLVTAGAIVGAYLNVKKRPSGFALWTLTNAANAARCISVGQYAIAGGFAVFFGLAVWGLIEWRSKS